MYYAISVLSTSMRTQSHAVLTLVIKKIRLLSSFLLVIGILSSSQPFESGLTVQETYRVHENGAGTWELTIDFTQAVPLITIASFFTKVTFETIQHYIHEALSALAATLADIPGISKVISTTDVNTPIVTFSFHFNNINVLNKAMQKVYDRIDHPGSTHFSMDPHAFVRVDTRNVAQLLDHYRTQIDAQVINLLPKNILSLMTYHGVYYFDKTILTASHPLAQISEDGKSLSLQHTLADACEKAYSWSKRIVF